MPKKVFKPHASNQLAYAYGIGEYLAGRRAPRVVGWSEREYKHLRKLAIYCHMMKVNKYTDAPDKERSSYFVDDIDTVPEEQLSELMENRSEPTWTDEQQLALEAGMAMLTDQEAQVVKWKVGEGMSYDEIAERMDLKPNAVYQAMRRAERKWETIRERMAKRDIL